MSKEDQAAEELSVIGRFRVHGARILRRIDRKVPFVIAATVGVLGLLFLAATTFRATRPPQSRKPVVAATIIWQGHPITPLQRDAICKTLAWMSPTPSDDDGAKQVKADNNSDMLQLDCASIPWPGPTH